MSEKNIFKKDVFISYRTREGWELANLVFNYLNDRGISVFLDKRDLEETKPFDESLIKTLHETKIFVPIISGKSHFYNENKNKIDWVWKEITTFINGDLNNKIKKIYPIFEHEYVYPDNLYPEKKEIFDKIEKLNIERIYQNNCIQSLNKLYQWIKANLPKENKKDFNSYMLNLTDDQLKIELEKIHQQADSTRKIDKQIYLTIFNEFNTADADKQINVLDLGCSDGYKTIQLLKGYIEDLNQISNIIGIDNNKYYINQQIHNNKFFIENFDLSSSNLEDKINEIKIKYRIKQFDLIIISNTLLYLQNPEILVETAFDVLSNNGYIVVTDVDDGLNIMYPDNEEVLAKFNTIWSERTNAGNRKIGREIFSYLKNAGFSDINPACFMLPPTLTKLKTNNQKEFFERYNYLISDLSNRLESNYSLYLEERLDWLKCMYNESNGTTTLLDAYKKIEFKSESYIVYYAKKIIQ